ncbi:MAG: hypothetical protein ACK4IR_12270, partial [Thermosynechococcus sp.]
MGQQIIGMPNLTRNTADSGNKREGLGLDGYWERRARQEGLRIIVGERLELGKPLDPPAGDPADPNRRNEFYQHRTLRDDLAAVQATAVYHYKANGTEINSSIPDPFTDPYPGQDQGGYEPIACLATTHHHGTPQTVLRSIMFNQYSGIQGLPSDFKFFDFFTGRGTNGWEFAPPEFDSPEMRQAMRNLVAYASDGVYGAFPPKQETGGTQIHPDPSKTRAGNFSNLARALLLWENSSRLRDLSLADQSTIHTAGCMLGMLAHSVKTLRQDLNLITPTLKPQLDRLEDAISELNEYSSVPPPPDFLTNGEVIPPSESDTTPSIRIYRKGFSDPLAYRGGYLDPNAYITALISRDGWRQRPLQETNSDVNARLARLIALKEQVEYDLNPDGYNCGIPNLYPNLKKVFCLGKDRRGFVIGADFDVPAPNATVTVKVEDAPGYNFDVRESDRGSYVYVTGVGQMILRDLRKDETTGKVLTVTLENPAGGNALQRRIQAGASASIMETGTITRDASFDPNNNSTVTITYRLTPSLKTFLNKEDVIQIRRPTTGSGPNLGRLEGCFKVVEKGPEGTVAEATVKKINPEEIDPELCSVSGTLDIIREGYTIVVLSRKGQDALTRGTFNTVIKYPALRAIFNPPEGPAVNPSSIAASPRANPSAFLTPTEAASGILVNNIRYPNRLNQIIGFDGNAYNVAFLDNTLFNGREEMAVREMDIDLDLLRRTPI